MDILFKLLGMAGVGCILLGSLWFLLVMIEYMMGEEDDDYPLY